MHVGSQRPLVKWFPNTYGQHPARTKGPDNIFGCVIQHLLGDHALAGATLLPQPIEMASSVTVGNWDSALQA